MKVLERGLSLRQGGRATHSGVGLVHEMRTRYWAQKLAMQVVENGKPFGLGLVNGNGEPAWMEPSREEEHEFRRYVFARLRNWKQANRP